MPENGELPEIKKLQDYISQTRKQLRLSDEQYEKESTSEFAKYGGSVEMMHDHPLRAKLSVAQDKLKKAMMTAAMEKEREAARKAFVAEAADAGDAAPALPPTPSTAGKLVTSDKPKDEMTPAEKMTSDLELDQAKERRAKKKPPPAS